MAFESESGIAATHSALDEIRFPVSPTHDVKFNTLKMRLVPLACWRVEDINFEFASSIPTPTISKGLDHLAKLLAEVNQKDKPDLKEPNPITIFGHADPVGLDEENKGLSGRRARAIYGLLTRDTDEWEQLFSTDHPYDNWKEKSLQIMLDHVSGTPGQNTAPFRSDSAKRKGLFADYMKKLCPADLAPIDKKKGFLGQNADPKGKADYQGCGEFNPNMVFSQEEEKRFQDSKNKSERDRENSVNRRVMVLIFRKGSKVDPAKWPCPRANEGTAGCRKRFFSDGENRRNKRVPAERRLQDKKGETFACRFYERIIDRSPCEKSFPVPPVIPGTVRILDEEGKKDGCRFVAQGKTHKYKAVGEPPGGSFEWKVTGSVSIVGDATKNVVEVKGDKTSNALDDCELVVAYSVLGQKATQVLKLTVYEMVKIEAKLRATPCKRDGSKAEAMAAKSSTKDNKTFDATAITVIRECGDLKLSASVKPDATVISWDVERAADDTGLKGLPTHSADGDDKKRLLKTDATGSFHIHAFVDCNGNGKRDAGETGLILNVNIVEMQIPAGASNNQIIKRDTLFRNTRSTPTHLIVDSGTSIGAPAVNSLYTDAEFLTRPLAMKVTVKLVGGGPNQRRGVDRIGLGYIQTTTSDSITGTYTDGRTLKEVIVQDPTTPDPIVSGSPTMLAFPVRDHRGTDDNGTNVFINSSSDAEKSDIATGGQQRIVRFVDPPAIAINMRHPVTSSPLASISGSNNFDAFLVGFSQDFDENYTVLASGAWSITYGTFSSPGGWSKTGAAVAASSSMTEHSPAVKAESLNVERCPPGFVDNLRMDAR